MVPMMINKAVNGAWVDWQGCQWCQKVIVIVFNDAHVDWQDCQWCLESIDNIVNGILAHCHSVIVAGRYTQWLCGKCQGFVNEVVPSLEKILTSWCSSTRKHTLTVLKGFFDEDEDLCDSPDNHTKYVSWALDNFNFVYCNPDHRVCSAFPYTAIYYLSSWSR